MSPTETKVISADDFQTVDIIFALPLALRFYRSIGSPLFSRSNAGFALVRFAVMVCELEAHHGGIDKPRQFALMVADDEYIFPAVESCLSIWSNMKCNVKVLGWGFTIDEMISAIPRMAPTRERLDG